VGQRVKVAEGGLGLKEKGRKYKEEP